MSPDLSDVPESLTEAVAATLRTVGVEDGHIAVVLVDEVRIHELNRLQRGIDRPTDVLAFPVDGIDPVAGPRELGDVAICPEHCTDVTEAAVHGTLHLCGFDHQSDNGEMLALQEGILRDIGLPGGDDSGPAPELVTRAGFVGLAGRPNVGKSTLVNAMVGARVAIVSDRPQTTRRAARGVATDSEAGWQLVLIDLPGVQRPRDVLTKRMQKRVEQELAGADVALLVINGEEGVGPGDRFISKALLGANAQVPVICVVNKMDRIKRGAAARVLTDAAALQGVTEVFPVSAKTGDGLEELVQRLAGLMPEGHYMYPPEDRTDQPSNVLLAELIREQVLNRTRDEVPHSVEVSVTEVEQREDGLTTIRAEIWPETESQKGILIGRGGIKIQEIGTGARRRLEEELGTKVHLDLQVKVRRHWRRDGALLDRLGIE